MGMVASIALHHDESSLKGCIGIALHMHDMIESGIQRSYVRSTYNDLTPVLG